MSSRAGVNVTVMEKHADFLRERLGARHATSRNVGREIAEQR